MDLARDRGRQRRPGPPSWPQRRAPGPFHVATLLDNVPEHVLWLGAAALAGAVLVGGNSTHRGADLARDLAHTECQLLVTDRAHLPLVDGLDLGRRHRDGGGVEPPRAWWWTTRHYRRRARDGRAGGRAPRPGRGGRRTRTASAT